MSAPHSCAHEKHVKYLSLYLKWYFKSGTRRNKKRNTANDMGHCIGKQK